MQMFARETLPKIDLQNPRCSRKCPTFYSNHTRAALSKFRRFYFDINKYGIGRQSSELTADDVNDILANSVHPQPSTQISRMIGDDSLVEVLREQEVIHIQKATVISIDIDLAFVARRSEERSLVPTVTST